MDERSAIALLESWRWRNGPQCPCGGREYCVIRTRPGVRRCYSCGKQFTFRLGTIMEDSRLPAAKWVAAIGLFLRRPVSAWELTREIGVTYKTGLHLFHRLQFATTMNGTAVMSKAAPRDRVPAGKRHVSISTTWRPLYEAEARFRRGEGAFGLADKRLMTKWPNPKQENEEWQRILESRRMLASVKQLLKHGAPASPNAGSTPPQTSAT